MDIAHYKCILLYKGSGFAGFQRQAAERTVQGEFEAGLRKIGWTGQSILGAGRTDAGVHARGQVVAFTLEGWQHTTINLRDALNYYLPKDMAVQSLTLASEGFHPRFDARSRRYCYRIFCQPVREPLREDLNWRVWPSVKIELMNKAAQALIGSHDFCAFGKALKKGGVTVREVFWAGWQGKDDEYWFNISANAFLYHMVRRIVFVLVAIGQDQAPVRLIEEGLETGELELTGLAPPEGLVLEEVCYK